MILSNSQKDAIKQKIVSLQEHGQKRKIVIKIEHTPLPDRDCNILPFFKGLKNKVQTNVLKQIYLYHSLQGIKI